MKIKIIRFLAVVLICALLCGCSASVENLLTPPKLNAEQTEIYRELLNSVGSVKLKYPRSGDYRSAFVLENIDDEAGAEAMVFYESKNVQSGESALRLKFLDKDNGRWESVYDIACPGSEVDSISFSKLGNSDVVDIIVCFTMLNQTEKSFAVISYRGRTPNVLYSSVYSILEVYDLNHDDQNELLAVSTDKVNQVSSAMMFTNVDEDFVKLSETMLYGGAADYIRATKGRLDEKRTALFLDYSKGGGQSGTDVLYCYGNTLFCPNSMGANPASGLTSRMVNNFMAEIFCSDIDDDGFIEIPATTPLPGYETLPRAEQLCAVMWYTVTGDQFDLQHYSYFSGKYRFALLFPNRWRGVVTAVADFSSNEIIFVLYDEEIGLPGSMANELMRIRTVDKDDIAAAEAAKELPRLGESDDAIYCLIGSGGYNTDTMALTESELEKSFILL